MPAVGNESTRLDKMGVGYTSLCMSHITDADMCRHVPAADGSGASLARLPLLPDAEDRLQELHLGVWCHRRRPSIISSCIHSRCYELPELDGKGSMQILEDALCRA